MKANSWQFNLGYRWMQSDRHFTGTEEEEERQEEGSEVINKVHLFDVSVTYAFTERINLTGSLPYLIATREQLNRALNRRTTTQARGIGDFILIPRFWILDTKEHPTGNASIGLGGKVPTGEPNVTDVFITNTGGREVRTVDQSIQPGDGGWGLVFDAQIFKQVWRFVGYATGTYLINPDNTNNVQTFRARPKESVMSVPDQYQARGGVSYGFENIPGLALSIGVRLEGVPPYDIWGSSDGFRRPGYAFSIEPGIAYALGRHVFSVSAPVALVRERQVSKTDSQDGIHGDAAFADYMILAAWSFRWGGEAPAEGEEHTGPEQPATTAPLRP